MIVLLLALAAQVPAAHSDYYRIVHHGATIWVHGSFNRAANRVTWYPDDPFNVASVTAASAGRILAPPGHKIGRVSDGGVNWGVEAPKVFHRPPGFYAATPEARRYVQEDEEKTPDLHVTVIGSEDQCRPVIEDLKSHPAFAAVRGALSVQDYRPGEWAVDPSLGFMTTGAPTIMVQDREGRELWRAGDYQVGPDKLAEMLNAQLARRRDPNYDPERTPGPGSSTCPLGYTSGDLPAVLAASAICLFLIAKKRE